MFELFVVGTFWFWALIAAEILLLFVFVSNENGVVYPWRYVCPNLEAHLQQNRWNVAAYLRQHLLQV